MRYESGGSEVTDPDYRERCHVRRTRVWLLLCGLFLLALVPGCGGCSREKNKNSDFDRPKEQPAAR